MPVDELAGALDDQRLRAVQTGEVGGAAGFIRPVVEHAACLRQKLLSLAQRLCARAS
jgi:hypothetical protein